MSNFKLQFDQKRGYGLCSKCTLFHLRIAESGNTYPQCGRSLPITELLAYCDKFEDVSHYQQQVEAERHFGEAAHMRVRNVVHEDKTTERQFYWTVRDDNPWAPEVVVRDENIIPKSQKRIKAPKEA